MRKVSLWYPALLVAFILAIPTQAQTNDAQVNASKPEDRRPQFVPGELLVRFRDTASSKTQQQAHAAVAGSTARRFRTVRNLQLVRITAGTTVESALKKYRSDPSVLYAEPNYIRRAFDTPNDPMFAQQWSMKSTGLNGGTAGADIGATDAWTITKGSKQVVVAVIDTGVDYTHQDLAANMWKNTADCTNDGVDHDGNGYVNDCYGINTIYRNSDPMDDYSHGTHVAGIIGAAGNNGIGVAGVNWNVSLMACKFLDENGYGSDADAISCLEYVAMMKDRGVNIVATNNSWGGEGYSQALYDAAEMNRQRGILFIAAAGNWSDTNDTISPNYPSSFDLPNIISVAATDNADKLAYFSSYGRRSVAIAAPGDEILSTVRHNLYRVFSGTSMAAPHVTGVAALLAAQDSNRTWIDIRNLVLAGGTPVSSLAAKTATGRRLSAYGSLTCSNQIVTATLEPVTTKQTASSGKAVVFSVLHLNCAAPAGNLTVTISPGNQRITLSDDGQSPDQFAGDGTYAGQWIPSVAGTYSYTMPDGQTGTIIVDPYAFQTAQYQYRNIAGTGLALNDDEASWVESPFPISYAGSAYSGVGVVDNGILTFDSGLSALQHKPLPYALNETLVAPFWDDLLPAGLQRNVFWQVLGSAPNRELAIEWRNMSASSCSGGEGVTFQTVLFENSPDVLFNYEDTTFGGTCADHDGGGLATVGVQFDHSAATQYSFETASLQDGTSLRAVADLPNNPVPSVTSISPTSWAVTNDSISVFVNGTNLQPGSILLWNGKPRRSYYMGETSIVGYLDNADLNAKGTVQVSVFNPLPGGGKSNSLPFTIADPDFSIGASQMTSEVHAGEDALFLIYASGNPSWTGAVALTCSNLPTGGTCSFDPAAIADNEYSILTIKTPKPTALLTTTGTAGNNNAYASLTWHFVLVPLGVIAVGAGRTKRRKARMVALCMLALLAVGLLVSCGGGSSCPTCQQCPTCPTCPAQLQVYNITVTGTSGALQHSTTLRLVVLP